ncbi:MAG: EAL domain-containing protein [Gammaproteobacteria bacterium]
MAFLLVFLAEQIVENYEHRSAIESERVKVINYLSTIRARLEGVINSHLLMGHGLSAVIAANPDINQDGFVQIARGLLGKNSALRNIAGAPDMIISMIYPVAGNEAAIGLDYRSHPTQSDTAIRAMESDHPVLAGPLPLVQGGIGIIVREPVFLPADDLGEEPRFWGLVSSVIDANKLYHLAELDNTNTDIELVIRGTDGSGVSGPVFYGNEALFGNNPVTTEVTLPGGTWHMAAVPVTGWGQSPHMHWLIRIIGLLIAIAAMIATYQIFRSRFTLAQTNTKLNALLDTIPDLVWLKDPHGVFLACNTRFEQFVGSPESEIINKTDYDFFPTDIADFFRKNDQAAIDAGVPTMNEEWLTYASDGHKELAETIKTPLISPQGHIIGVLGIARDITDRKQAEYELLEQKELLERTGRLAQVGGWQFDVATMKGSWTAETARIHDLDPNSLEATVAEGLNFMHDPARSTINQAIQAAIEQAKPYDLELEIISANGAHKWVHTIGIPVVEDGKVVRIEGAIQDITKHKQAETKATQRKHMLDSVILAIPDLFFLMDNNGTILDYRAQQESSLYVAPESFLGKCIQDVVPDEIGKLFTEKMNILYQQDQLITYEYNMTLPDGEHRFEARMSKLADSTQCVAIVRDVTQQYHARQALIESEERYRSLLENAPFPVVLTRMSDGTLRYGNQRAEILFGLKRDQGIGLPASRFYQDSNERQRFLEHLTQDGSVYDQEIRMLDVHGQPFWSLLSASIVEFEHEPAIFAAINDITQHKQAEEDIRHLVHYDALTELPNRTLLNDRIEYSISIAQRNQQPIALLFIDLDRFKNVNDSLGHQIGDQLLIEVAKRLKLVVRKNDTVSRLGGDEFILLLTTTNADGAAHVATNIIQSLSKPFMIDHHELGITPSIGIAIYPNDGENTEALLQCADSAMYRAKHSGRNTYCFFTSEMHKLASRTLQLENALRRALERNELLLHYQPQIDINSQEIIGCEALLRWNHPELGLISPAEFIPIAEDSGQILPIGEWVLRTAVKQNLAWQQAGFKPLVMAVNISAAQFRQLGLTVLVNQVLQEYKLEPHYLELELTESITMEDPLAAIEVIERLHKQGIRLSIDDFGTGYSSLSYLKRFKIHKLKIDQSFIRNIITDPEDEAIVDAVISLAKSLKLQTIAEGVETSQQLDFLRNKNCDEIQGYLISKPLPADEFEAFLRTRP